MPLTVPIVGASGNIQYLSANSSNFGGQFLGALMGP